MKQKGGVTIPVFECIFHGSESIESFIREFDKALYEALPNLYVICVAQTHGRVKKIVAGFFIKTSYTHHDKEFLSVMTAALNSSEKLHRFVGEHTSFLPARLGISGTSPLSEQEMLKIMMTQYVKYAADGSA